MGKSASLRIHRIQHDIAEIDPRPGMQHDPGQIVIATNNDQSCDHDVVVSVLDALALDTMMLFYDRLFTAALAPPGRFHSNQLNEMMVTVKESPKQYDHLQTLTRACEMKCREDAHHIHHVRVKVNATLNKNVLSLWKV